MLNESLHEYDDNMENTVEQELGTFKIDNDKMADWALEKIKAEKEDMERLVALCEQKIQHYKEKADQFKKSYESSTSFLTSCLAQYFNSVPNKKKTKTQETYKLASGTLKLKIKGPELVRNDDELIKWLEGSAPEFIKIKKSPDWAEFKKNLNIIEGNKVITRDGELVEGVSVFDRPSEFVVEV